MKFHESMNDEQLHAMSSLALAHVGDGVYELMVRSMLARRGELTHGALHRRTVGYVSAVAQAKAAAHVLPGLGAEELAVYKRARNTRAHTNPSGCTAAQYHAATALEALFGWLWLTGETGRLEELFEQCMEGIDAP